MSPSSLVRRSCAAAALVLLVALAASSAHAQLVLPTGTTGGARTWPACGINFTVGGSSITLDALGYEDLGANGNGYGGALDTSHFIGIWNSSGTLIATATVPSGIAGAFSNGDRYLLLSSPITLTAGQTYTIGANTTTDGYYDGNNFSPGGPIWSGNGITITENVFNGSSNTNILSTTSGPPTENNGGGTIGRWVPGNATMFSLWTGAASNVWNTSDSNWNNGSATTYSDGTNVAFDDTAGANTTVNLSVANVQPAAVIFNNQSTNYTLQGTYGIAGSASVTLQGTGLVTLANSNSYTGTTAITGGTLQIGNGSTGSLGAGGNYSAQILNNGALVVNTTTNETFGGVISGNGSLRQSGNNVLTFTGANTYTGGTTVSAGTLTINQVGSGSNNVNIGSGANTQLTTSALNVASGAVVTFNTGSNFASSNNGLTLTGGGTIQLASGSWRLGGAGSNVTSVNMSAGGLINVQSGATLMNDYSGGAWGNNQASLNVAGTFNLRGNNTTVDALTGAGSITDDFTGNTLTVGVAGGSGTFTGTIGGTTVNVVKSGGGAQILAGANTYTGSTTVNGGTLAVTLPSTNWTSSGGSVAGGAYYKLDFSNQTSLASPTIYHQISGSSPFAASGFNVVMPNSTTLSAGQNVTLPGTNYGLYMQTDGNLVLYAGPGQSNAIWASGHQYSGNYVTMQSDGNLVLYHGTGVYSGWSSGGSPSGSSTVLALGANGGLAVAAAPSYDAIGTNAVSGTMELYSTNTNAPYNGGVVITSGGITGSGVVNKTGPGGIAFGIFDSSGNNLSATGSNGLNAFNGTLNITAGTVSSDQQTGSTPVGSGQMQVNISSGAVLNVLGGGLQIDTLNGAGSVTSSTGLNNPALTIGANNGNSTFSGVISGALPLTKAGNGTQVLTGANTYTGGTTVSGGTLTLANNLALQNSVLYTDGGGNVNVTVTTPTLGGLNGSTNLATLINGGYGSVTSLTLNPASGVSATYSGVISDGATGMGLLKSGAGTQVLAGANTYTGGTTVTAGSLVLSSASGSAVPGNLIIYGNGNGGANVWATANNQLSANTVVSNGNATQWGCFTTLGTTQTIAGLSNTGGNLLVANDTTSNPSTPSPSTSTAGTLILAGSGNYTFAGWMQNAWGGGGTLGLTVAMSGSGSQTLSGGNVAYTGATTVSGGTLQLQDTTSFNSAVNVGNSGTLNLVRTSTGFGNRSTIAGNNITGSGVINVNNAANSAGNTDGGWARVSGGTLNFSGTINVNSGVFATDGGAIVLGTATVNVASGAVMALHDTIGWTIGGLNGAGDVTPAQGGTGTWNLTVGNGDASGTFTGVIHGTGNSTDGSMEAGYLALTKTGAGIEVLSGANTYTGATTISGGTLAITGAGVLGSGNYPASITNNAALVFNTSTNQTLAGAISGAGSLAQSGNNVLTLSGNNASFNGPVSVSGGTLELASVAAAPAGSTVAVGPSAGLQLDAAGATLSSLSVADASTLVLPSTGTTGTTVTNALTFVSTPSVTVKPVLGSVPSLGSTYNLITGSAAVSGTPGTITTDLSAYAPTRVTGTTSISGNNLVFTVATGPANLVWNNNTNNSTWDLGTTANFNNNGTNDVFQTFDSVTFDDTATPGAVTLNGNLQAGVVTVNNSTGNYTFSGTGALTGPGSLVKSGTATLVLTGNNSYTGGTTVNGGVLQIGNGSINGTIGSGTYSVASAAKLYLNYATASGANFSNIAGAGTLELNAVGSGNWDGSTLSSSFSGTVQIDRGRLYAPSAGAGLGGATTVVVNNGGQFADWVGGTYNQNFILAGTGWGEGGYETAIRGGGTILNGSVTLSAAAAVGGVQLNGTLYGNGYPLTIGASGVQGATLNGATAVGSSLGGISLNYGTLVIGSSANIVSIGGISGPGGGGRSGLNVASGGVLTATSFGTAYNVSQFNISGTASLGSVSFAIAAGNTMTGAGVLNVSSLTIGNWTTLTDGMTGGTMNVGSGGIYNGGTGNNYFNAGATTIGATAPWSSSMGIGLTDATTGTTFDTTGGNIALSGGLNGSGILHKAGPGTLYLSGANTYTGATSVNSGILNIGAGGSTGSLSTSSVITDNATLAFNRSNTATQGADFSASPIAGSGALVQMGPGMLILNAANGYGGGTTVSGGTLQLGNSSALGVGGLAVNGGVFDLGGYSVTVPSFSGAASPGGMVTNSGTAPATLNVAQGINTTYQGAIADGANPVALSVTGSGLLNLSGSNGYSGGTYVGGGTLQLGAINALGSGGLTANAGVLDLNGVNLSSANNNALPSLAGANGTITDSSSGSTTWLTVNQSANTTFGGSIQTGPQGRTITLAKYGAGSLTLAGNNTTAGGASVHNSGTLNISGSLTTASITSNDASSLVVVGLMTAGPVNVYGGSTLSGNGTINTVTSDGLLYQTTAASTFGGTIAGIGPIEVASGTLVLAGSNTFAGGAAVDNNPTAVLRMGAANALPSGPGAGDLTVSGSGTFDLNGNTTNLNGLWGNGTVDNTSATPAVLVVGNNNVASTFAGVMQNTGGAGTLALTKTGTGAFTLAATNFFGGTTTVQQGTLVLGAAGAVPGDIAVTGGTLDATQFAQGIGSLTMSPGGGLNLSAGNLLTCTGTATLAGTIDILNFSSGTAELMSYGLLAPSSSFTTVLGLTSAYKLVYDPGQLDIVTAAVPFTGLGAWGSGVGAATWSNSTNWTDANGNNGVPGDGTRTTPDTATLSGSGSTAITLDISPTVASLSFSGTNYVLSGSGTLALQGSAGTAGTATVSVTGGTQTIGSSIVLGSSASFSLSSSGQMTVSGNIGDDQQNMPLALTGDGTGTLVLSGTNTYGGGTYVDAGTLIVTTNTALLDGSSLTVGAGGTFIFDPTASASSLSAAPQVRPAGVEAVPEPGTIGLLLAAAISSAVVWRRRRHG